MAATDTPVQLHVQQMGNGPSLVILHGLFGNWENWRSHARQLSDSFQVTLMDLRNHGESPHREQMTYPLMAADVAHTCRQLNIERTHVVGHSMGGKTAMQLALDFPDLVERLIVVDIAPVQYPPHHQRILQGMQSIAAQPLGSRKEADNHLSEFVDEAGIRSFLLKNLQRDEQGQYQLRINLDAIVDQYESIAAAIAPSAPTQGKQHTGVQSALFIKGGDSDYLLETHRDAVVSLFPKAEVKVVAGTGHWLHSEKPAVVQKIVRDYLSQQSH